MSEMVLCPDCDRDMLMDETIEYLDYDPYIHTVRIYECPECFERYRVSESYKIVEHEIESVEREENE